LLPLGMPGENYEYAEFAWIAKFRRILKKKGAPCHFSLATWPRSMWQKLSASSIGFWDSAGSIIPQEESSWTPVIRACALNVVLLCDEGKNEREFENLLADITVRHPCRAILAVIALAEVEKVEAWVTAHCHFLPGRLDKQMCCEQITVKWSGQSFKSEGLASVVTPLVIPELPSWLFAGSKHLTAGSGRAFLSLLRSLTD
jgi:hypothetical protein